MSWEVINEVLGLAAVDTTFCQQLLLDSLGTVQEREFELTLAEQEAFRGIVAHDIYEFSQIVLARLAAQSVEQGSKPV